MTMNDPILIQIDDEIREATPEEAEQIRDLEATSLDQEP